MALALRRKQVYTPFDENIADFIWTSASQVTLPASTILIGTGGGLSDATLFSAADLTFDFANGTGNNGLDTGVEGSGWYALYAVPLTSTVYMLKATTRHPISAPGPTGFTKWRYLGMFRNYDGNNPNILEFNKSGDTIMAWASGNTNMTGIPIYQSGAATTAVSQTGTQSVGAMTSHFPFAKAMYGLAINAAPSTAGNAFCELRVIVRPTGTLFGGQFQHSMTWNNGSPGTNVNPGGIGWGFVEGAGGSVDVQLYTPNAVGAGTFNWRLCLAGYKDPILAKRVRG